jgi:hypothetical protein
MNPIMQANRNMMNVFLPFLSIPDMFLPPQPVPYDSDAPRPNIEYSKTQYLSPLLILVILRTIPGIVKSRICQEYIIFMGR